MKIQVITQVPDADVESGNLCDEQFRVDVCRTNGDHIFRPYNKDNENIYVIPVQLEVFSLAEIIIVNESGREIGGWQRKADKWHVEYQEFDICDIEKAVKLAEKLLNN